MMGKLNDIWVHQPAVKQLSTFKLPEIKELRLRNGIPLTVINDNREDVYRLDIVFGAGQVDQHKLLQATTTCRMLKEGTHGMSSGMIAEKADYYGGWLESATSFLYSRLTLYSLTKYADEMIALVAAIVREASFPENEFGIINDSNKAYAQVLAARSNVKSQRALLTALFGSGHICGRFADSADYDALTTSDLRQFYDKFYNSSNCHLFFSGTLKQPVLSRLEEELGKDAWGVDQSTPQRTVPARVTSSQKRVFTECPAAGHSSVSMGCFFIPRSDSDFLVANFFNTLFGGFFGSRLMAELREKKGLTYGIGSTVSLYPFDTLLLISSETSPENVEELIEGVYQEIDRLRDTKIGQEELQLVRNYYVSDLLRSFEEPYAVADYCINMHFYDLPYDSQQKVVKRVMAMTPEDIQKFACKWLCRADFRESVSGKEV